MADKIYVDKAHYDVLLRQHMCLRREHKELSADWEKLWDILKTGGISNFELESSINQFSTLPERASYALGYFNCLSNLRKEFEKMEETRYVSPDQ